MPDMLRTGLAGLLTFQRALATTSHNISNATTEGYSRQRADLKALDGQAYVNGFVGRGVKISTVEQITDEFVDLRLRDATTDAGRSEKYAALAARLESLVASAETGLSGGLEGMFGALQTLSADPASAATRELMLSEASTLVDRFNFLDAEIGRIAQEVNGELGSLVAEVNALSSDIASINRDIVLAIGQGGGNLPNDLLDQRRERIRALSELVAVNTVEQDDGALNVFIGNGQPLVIGSDAQLLTTAPDPLDAELTQVARTTGATTQILSNQIGGGKLGALLDFRREALPLARNELGRTATVLAETFNAYHARGMDLDGNLGGDFFIAPQPSISAASYNTGSATVGAVVTDATQLQASGYQLSYDGASFTLLRESDGASVVGPGPLSMDGFQVTIAGAAAAGDTFLVNPVSRGAQQIGLALSSGSRIAAAAPVQAGLALGNLGDGDITQPDVLDAADPALLDPIELIFNDPPTTFDVVDVNTATVLAAGVAYVENAPIAVNGWQTSVYGVPVAGDTFRVETNVGGIGDNRNALLLGGLQSERLVGGSSSYGESYAALVGRVGVTSRQARLNAEASTQLREAAQNRRNEVSGVNLDEEAIDLTRYQRAYQAMAQTIETSNTIFDTLLAAVAR